MKKSQLILLFLVSMAASVGVMAEDQASGGKVIQNEAPPPLEVIDDSISPDVTIRQDNGDTIEEYRVNGRLYQIKVKPARGAPYILIDRKGDGSFVRMDGPGAGEVSVPMWVIGTF